MSKLAKHATGVVDAGDPWADDVLKRRELATQLTQALSTVTQPFVLGLHGTFGNGKTFFIRRWRQDLINHGDVAVYFNAWESDYVAEPLMAFTTAIQEQLETSNVGISRETAKDLTRSAGRIALKAVLPRLVSIASAGVVQASDIAALAATADHASGVAAEITERVVEDAVKRHEGARNEMERFRELLATCAEGLAKREQTSQIGRLIVFVDELDRCRPDYGAAF